MSRFRVTYSALAEKDLLLLWSHLAEQDRSIADHMLDQFQDCWHLLAFEENKSRQSRRLHPAIDIKIGYMTIHNYVSLYYDHGSMINILRILHKREDYPLLIEPKHKKKKP